MVKYTKYFDEIDSSSSPCVGGKCASLGEMSKAGFPIPQGFCITTSAYSDFIASSHVVNEFFDRLEQLQPHQMDEIRSLGNQIRNYLQSIRMPKAIESAIVDAWTKSGEDQAYAVRSSATAEDLPNTSFAGQHETYLNVIGMTQLLQAVQKCWASLFTDRAIVYRAQNGFDHRSVLISVVVQQMIFPDLSGIMFTADPVNGHRRTISINASYGMGEALVSGVVTADLYQVRRGQIIRKQISEKKKAIYSVPGGGTAISNLPPELQNNQALSDEKILELAELGSKIGSHYGTEQDIEWCLAGNKFFILQSRPITTLYPVPNVGDDNFHVFISFSHLQMMPNAMRPLAISVLRMLVPFGKDSANSYSSIAFEAGGRLFLDITPFLYSNLVRRYLIFRIKIMDELISGALSKVLTSKDFMDGAGSYDKAAWQVIHIFRPVIPLFLKLVTRLISDMIFHDPTRFIDETRSSVELAINQCEYSIIQLSGAERIKEIQKNVGNNWMNLFGNRSFSHVPLGLIALPIANTLAKLWLGKELEVGILNRSLPGDVTSELGLMIGDLADTARMYPEVMDYLQVATDDTFYQDLSGLKEGGVFKVEFDLFMKRYGMRCAGEIDITNPRWHEVPTLIVPSILNHMKTNASYEHMERFRQGQIEADEAVKNIIILLKKTRGGYFKARLMSRLLSIYRNSAGLREFPKYTIIRFFDIYRQALLDEARYLREKGVLQEEYDVFYLSLNELVELYENQLSSDELSNLINSRKKAYEHYQKLSPPRVITSEGEVFTGIRSEVKTPEGALIGTPASAGIAEGYARVVLKPEEAVLKKGDVLVAPFTDPGWTPLFQSVNALVVEVGGTMTHGSVVAREYGIPAVVGIENITKILKDGQFIRVDGTRGVVEILNQKQ